MSMTHFVKRTWAEIDLDAAAHNFDIIKEAAAGGPVIAVIKADAYGHGAKRMAELYVEMGAAGFAVSNIEEAIELRRDGIRLPILILGYTPVEEAADLVKYDILQAVFSREYAQKLSASAVAWHFSIKMHLKLDTGMGRIGFNCRSAAAVDAGVQEAVYAARLPGLRCEGAFTHFATADRDNDPDGVFTAAQYDRFSAAVAKIEAAGVPLPVCHCCNSAATMLHADKHLNGMRAGIILYGLTPNPGLEFIDRFQPVMSLKSTVSMVKRIHAGETVSYGRTFAAAEDMDVATVSIGYADGYPRTASNKGRVLIHGRYAPVVGRVCMDQLIVDVSGIPDVREGDVVTMFGTDGGFNISAEEVAGYADTINYETVCDVGLRVPRVYLKGGSVESVLNRLI